MLFSRKKYFGNFQVDLDVGLELPLLMNQKTQQSTNRSQCAKLKWVLCYQNIHSFVRQTERFRATPAGWKHKIRQKAIQWDWKIMYLHSSAMFRTFSTMTNYYFADPQYRDDLLSMDRNATAVWDRFTLAPRRLSQIASLLSVVNHFRFYSFADS